MPEIISCPECDRKLRVPDHLLGKKVKCPGCGTMFTGQAEAAEEVEQPKSKPRPPVLRDERIGEKPRAGRRPVVPPPEELDEDDRPRSRRRRQVEEEEDEDYPRSARSDDDDEDSDRETQSPRKQRLGWEKVRKGINLTIMAIWVSLSAILFGMIGGFIVGAAGASAISSTKSGGQVVGAAAATGVGFIILFILLGLIGLAANVLNIVGRVFCLNVPAKRGSSLKGLAVASLGLLIGQVACNYLGTAVDLGSGAGFGGAGLTRFGAVGSGVGAIFGFLGIAVAIAAFIVFLFFLRSVAFAVKARSVANTIKTFLITVACSIGASILLFGIMMAVAGAAVFSTISGGGGTTAQGAGAAAGTAMGAMFVALALGCIMLVLFIALFVWYIVILFQVRGAIDRYVR